MGRYVAIEPNLLRVLADQCANAADAYYDNVQVARRSLAAASLEIDIPAVDTAVRSERERLRQRAADVEEWNASYHASWRHPSRPSARVVQLSREFGGKPVPLPPVLRRRAADRDVAELVDLANNPSPARLRAVIADLRAHWDDPAFALEFAKRVAALKLTWVNDPIRDLVGPTALLVCVAQGIDPAEPGGLEHLFFEAAIPILALASPHLTGSETRALFANASDEMLGAARENADSFDPHALAQLAGEVVDQLPVDLAHWPNGRSIEVADDLLNMISKRRVASLDLVADASRYQRLVAVSVYLHGTPAVAIGRWALHDYEEHPTGASAARLATVVETLADDSSALVARNLAPKFAKLVADVVAVDPFAFVNAGADDHPSLLGTAFAEPAATSDGVARSRFGDDDAQRFVAIGYSTTAAGRRITTALVSGAMAGLVRAIEAGDANFGAAFSTYGRSVDLATIGAQKYAIDRAAAVDRADDAERESMLASITVIEDVVAAGAQIILPESAGFAATFVVAGLGLIADRVVGPAANGSHEAATREEQKNLAEAQQAVVIAQMLQALANNPRYGPSLPPLSLPKHVIDPRRQIVVLNELRSSTVPKAHEAAVFIDAAIRALSASVPSTLVTGRDGFVTVSPRSGP